MQNALILLAGAAAVLVSCSRSERTFHIQMPKSNTRNKTQLANNLKQKLETISAFALQLL